MTRNDGWTGRASAPVHHGEILQGVFAHEGNLRRGLVTLPCALYSVRASFTPRAGGGVTVLPRWKSKARRAAVLALAELGAPAHGSLRVSDDVPLRRGFGSSTGDVLASLGAVQNAFASPLPTETVARLAVRAEGASDSVMFTSTTVLFAHRNGEVIEDFGHPLPPLRVLGFCSAPGGGDGVDTLALPPARYGAEEIRDFDRLRTLLREAVLAKDVGLVGEVATASAQINQRRLPVPRFERLLSIAEESGAVGVQAAHSGDIAGLLFDRGDLAVDSRTALARALLREAGTTEHWEFSTDD